MSEPVRLSVVLPVLDEARDLGALLDALRDQEPVSGGVEILVADGGSTDGTRDLVHERARTWPALRLVENPGRRSAAGRNAGAREARGEYLLFLDGHCALPRPDLLRRTVELFEETGADALCRPQPLTGPGAQGWASRVAAARHSPLGHAPGSDIYADAPGFTAPESAGAAYPRSVWLELGGYDERFDACEDVEFNHRVGRSGRRAYRHPDLTVAYRPRGGAASLARQMVRYGRGRARLFARHPRCVPGILLGLTLATAAWLVLLAARPPAALATAGVLVAAYAAVCLAEAWRVSRDPQTALVFPVIHFGLLAGFWRGLFEAGYFARPPRRPDDEGGHRRAVA